MDMWITDKRHVLKKAEYRSHTLLRNTFNYVTRERYTLSMKESSKENNKKIGNLGEDIAAKILQNKGFRIKERNYKTKFGEIDIVAEKGDRIHFVEVKTFSREKISRENKTGEGYRPEELVTPEKLSKIKKTGDYYLFSRENDTYAQVDVVAITLNSEDRRVTYTFLENVL